MIYGNDLIREYGSHERIESQLPKESAARTTKFQNLDQLLKVSAIH
jgi:hypothetical protein